MKLNWIAGWITPTGTTKRCRCWKHNQNGKLTRVYKHPQVGMVFAQICGEGGFAIVSADASVEQIKQIMELYLCVK